MIIRQRVRGRIGTRLHHEPSVQTRNKGSQDEYVRFNVVNDSSRTISNRQRSRPRSRAPSHGSQVQTDGNEYIKIHALQQQRLVATTTPAPSTTTTTVSSTEEDIDYGFIRPPNFRPVHPVDNRFQQPITYRPHFSEVGDFEKDFLNEKIVLLYVKRFNRRSLQLKENSRKKGTRKIL